MGVESKPAKEEGLMLPFLGCDSTLCKPATMGVGEGGRMAVSARRGSMTFPTRHRIEVGGGGLDTALPWVQFDIVQARDDRDGNPNHAMLIREVFVDIITNHEDAEQQVEHDLAKKRRAKSFCFICTIEKNHDRVPRKSLRLGGISCFVLPSPPSMTTLLWEVPILPPGSSGRPPNGTPPSGRSSLLRKRRRTTTRKTRWGWNTGKVYSDSGGGGGGVGGDWG